MVRLISYVFTTDGQADAEKVGDILGDGTTTLAQGTGNKVLHTGFNIPSFLLQLDNRISGQVIIVRLYWNIPLASEPPNRKTQKKTNRNDEIKASYTAGASVPSLAREYGISEQRIHQILRDQRK